MKLPDCHLWSLFQNKKGSQVSLKSLKRPVSGKHRSAEIDGQKVVFRLLCEHEEVCICTRPSGIYCFSPGQSREELASYMVVSVKQ